MIFSELYSAYYNTVAAILARVIDGEHSEKELQEIVTERAFGESVLTILPALKSGKWQLLRPDGTTPLKHRPTMPLTDLQKRWLKAISLDPRIRLFGVNLPELADVAPLFTPDDYYVYDRYSDGDPFGDEEYIRQFRVILQAIREGGQIRFEMTTRKGQVMFVRCRPLGLEYSEKDDKFRMITAGWRAVSTVNLARIRNCRPYEGDKPSEGEGKEVVHRRVTVRLRDERNALERFLLHFAHFEKRAEKTDDGHYTVTVQYSRDDETEMVIRVLSFGPMAEVTEPESFRALIVDRLKQQKACGLN